MSYKPLGFPFLVRMERIDHLRRGAAHLRGMAHRYAADNEQAVRQMRLAREYEEKASKLEREARR
jgi:hypothetical protein